MRLRSANRGNAYNTWYVNTSGNVNNNNAYWANAVAPIVIISMAKSICAADVAKLLSNHKEPVVLALWPNNTVATRQTYGPATLLRRRTGKKKRLNKQELISYDALYETYCKCRRGVSWKPSVAHFVLNAVEEITKLTNQLNDGTYKPRKPKPVKITYPKPRDGLSIAFRDRVYQRSLNDNAVYPLLTKSFAYDNAACQRGKGTDFARARLKRHLRRYFMRYGYDGYILQIDIKGYYPHMRHDVAKIAFERHLPPDVYMMAANVLDGQYSGDVGYNPGSQMVQIAGISTLDGLDHYIKERLHAKFYLRYMDDFLLIHHDRHVLEFWLHQIKRRLSLLGFEVSPKKTTIKPIKHKFRWLGFDYHVTITGKIIMSVNPARVKHERRKLRRMVKLAKQGRLTRDKIDECYASWRNHASKGNSYKLLRRMDKFYESLWREVRK